MVVVLLERKPLPQSEVLWSRFSSRISLYLMPGIQAKELNIGFIRPMVWESFRCLWQIPSGLSWGVASVWPLYHKGLIGGVLQRWLAFWKVLPSSQRNTRALWETIGFLVTHLTKALLPDCCLAGLPALGIVLLVPNVHLRMLEATVLLGTFNAVDIFWYPSLYLFLDTILSRSSMGNSFNLTTWFLLWLALSTVGLYMDKCAFPSHVQSIEFTTGGLQSSFRNNSRMINGNRMCNF